LDVKGGTKICASLFLREVPVTNETESISVALFALELSQYSIPSARNSHSSCTTGTLASAVSKRPAYSSFQIEFRNDSTAEVTPQLHDSVAVHKQPRACLVKLYEFSNEGIVGAASGI
jgi:hypothetical protein